MTNAKRIFCLVMLLALSACGFQLRGEANLPFATLYLESANSESPLLDELRRNMEINKVNLVSRAEDAEVVLNIISEAPDKQILTLGGTGRVNEFQLRYRVALRAYDKAQQELITDEEILLQRDFQYDDTQILAKEAEEALLVRSMYSEMAQRIVRRLGRIHPTRQ
ncbi:MAG: LPS assembly lipoprotein LptE [Pseudomonadota bacterium]